MPEGQETQTQEPLPNEELLADLATYAQDPLGFVKFAFPWAEPDTELQDYKGPDTWQTEVLEYLTHELQTGRLTSNDIIATVLRIAIAAGNGPGKTALIAWIILWAISTVEDTRGVVTANTDTQLRTKTWAELAKWHRLFIAKHIFVLTATAIYARAQEHQRTWRIDQVPWSEEKTEAFAGLHNKGKRVLLIFDEASAIPDKIWEVSEGALTDSDTEILWFVSGNPTRNTGRFRECWGKFRHRWRQWQIDIRKSTLVNAQEVKQWIEDLGIDSDWVRVHVLGLFPRASTLQFIPSDVAEAARGRQVRPDQYTFAPKILGLDNAWTGGDEIVIGLRQGLVYRQLAVFQKNDDDAVIAGALAKFEDDEHADAVFIDQGYGTGVFSFGKQINRKWTLISFGSKSAKPGFLNKRAEMWGDMLQWLREGGCIPNDQRMIDDLTGPEAYPNLKGQIVIESKKDMLRRGLASPGRADALALTFAMPVVKKSQQQTQQNPADYDPLAEMKQNTPTSVKPYDPLA